MRFQYACAAGSCRAGRPRAARAVPSCLRKRDRCRATLSQSSPAPAHSPNPAPSCGDRAESPARDSKQKDCRPPLRPRRAGHATSFKNAIGSSTTPLPMTLVHSGRRIPPGTSWRINFFALDNDRVSGIMAAGIARHYLKTPCKYVDNFAFAFVAPLGAHNNRGSASLQFSLRLEFARPQSRPWGRPP